MAKTKEQKRLEAELRKEAWDKLTLEEKLAKVDSYPGRNDKVRAKILKALEKKGELK